MTWNEGMVEHFGNLGGILNLAPLLEEHLPSLPNLSAWTDYLLYQNQNPATGEIFSIMQRRVHVPRLNMFMREDWLNTLGLPAPTTTAQFADTLRAFRDNADALGVDMMVPWAIGSVLHISGSPLLDAYIDHASVNDVDWWVNTVGNSSLNQRHIFLPGYREGVRILSQWYDEGLILQDFPVVDGTFIDDLIIAGNAGVYVGNWDHPWRTTPNIQNRMAEENPEARLIPIDPFPNPVDGRTYKMIYPSSGFHIFIPTVSRNPVGALQYLDWMSRIENRLFLQTGVEGYHHEWTEVDGVATPAMLPVDEATSERRWYSPNNIDLTLVINNVDVGDPLANVMFLTFNFPGIDSQRIIDSYDIAMANGRAPRMITIPGGVPITSEFLPTFTQMVDDFLVNVVTSPAENFDSLWDAGIQNILNAGAQAAIDERRAGVEALGLVD
jgi:putative aldouronate transport system substrate-binding protein